jgi:hypothetical protein
VTPKLPKVVTLTPALVELMNAAVEPTGTLYRVVFVFHNHQSATIDCRSALERALLIISLAQYTDTIDTVEVTGS